MELKRILARDTRSAMEQAIKTYGPDVLVISNHQVAGQTELVVAIEVALEASSPAEQPSAGSSRAAEAPASLETPTASFRDSLQMASQSGARAAQGQPSVLLAAPLAAPALLIEPATAEPAIAQPAAPAAAAAANPTRAASIPPAASEQDARDYLRGREIVEMVREEISSLRREFRMRQQTSAWQGGLNLAPAVGPLAQALQEAGIPGTLRTLLLDGLSQAVDAAEGLQILREQLLHHLKRPSASVPAQGVHVLAGPSGAGKSLMTARLAGLAAQSGCEQVAVISYQDVRAGAWSQTQMLAAQLGVEAYRAGDAQALRLLVDELSTRKLVLIDTAGVQMGDHVRQILAQAGQAQCHAVLPADASSATVQRVLGQGLPFQSLLLTKLDEASSPWPLLQFLSDNPLRIAGASQGPRPSDLSLDFTLDQLVDLALAPLACTLESTSEIAGTSIERALTGTIGLEVDPDPETASTASVRVTVGAAASQYPSDSAGMAQAASALSPTLASIAGLPAVPVFLSTAQVLGAAPAANKRRATSQTDARAQTPEAAEPAKVAPALQGAARKKAAAAAADTPAAPAASSRKRKSTEALVVPVAVSRSRRKASAASAHP
ncbi:MAG: Signal recognition particle 54 kDa protein [Pseudomonadota bacterium]